jgi:hypothetical protein
MYDITNRITFTSGYYGLELKNNNMVDEFIKYIIDYDIKYVIYLPISKISDFEKNDIYYILIILPSDISFSQKKQALFNKLTNTTRCSKFMYKSSEELSDDKICVLMQSNVVDECNDEYTIYEHVKNMYMHVFSHTQENMYFSDTRTLYSNGEKKNHTNIINLLMYAYPYRFNFTRNIFSLTKEIVEYVFHPIRMERMSAEYGMEMCEFIDLH